MPSRSPFGARFDEGIRPLTGHARRKSGPAPGEALVRFSYPRLEAPPELESLPLSAAPPEPAPSPPPPPPSFSAAEVAAAVETARQEASAETEAQVRTELDASLEQRQVEALTAIAERLASSQDGLDQALAARAGASRDLALAVARTLVAKALARQPLADIEGMFREVVVRLEGLPWLELRLPPSLVPSGQASLVQAAEEADFRGEIRVIPDARLGPGDARLIWQDGAAERDLARLEAEVTLLVETWLPAASQAPGDDPGGRRGIANAAPAPAGPPAPPADLDDARMDGYE